MLTLKVIKQKAFTAKDTPQVHYTCAYKGRVFSVSTLRFDTDDIVVKDSVLTLACEVEVLKNTSTDPLTGETKSYLDIVPKLGIALADI